MKTFEATATVRFPNGDIYHGPIWVEFAIYFCFYHDLRHRVRYNPCTKEYDAEQKPMPQ